MQVDVKAWRSLVYILTQQEVPHDSCFGPRQCKDIGVRMGREGLAMNRYCGSRKSFDIAIRVSYVL